MNAFEPRPSVIRLRRRLARRLALSSLAGMLALVGVVCVSVWLTAASAGAALGAIERGAPLVTLAWVVLGLVLVSPALWALDALLRPAPQPDGIRLPRTAARELFGLIDELADRAGVPAVCHVRITDAFNAAVVQRPGLGVVGRLRTELTIGLPLVHGLSPMQLGAVLAHEFGHLAAQRSGVCGWGAHLRAWWVRAFDTLLAVLPWPPAWLARHADRYCRDMVRLAHAEELEADAIAARMVGPELIGQTLVDLSRKAHFLHHDYWPRVHALHEADARAVVRPFREMGHGFSAGYPCMAMACERAVVEDEANADPFHPSLRRRLRALRVSGAGTAGGAGSAAEHYLAGLLPSLAWVFDRAWSELAAFDLHPMVSVEDAD